MTLVEDPRVEPGRRLPRVPRALAVAAAGIVLLSLVRWLTGADDLTSTGAFSATLRLAVPIALAGLGGVYAERTGVINIGLEGMMILGTWFGAWGGVQYGLLWGVVLGIVGGALGGGLHALATVTFGVDHIVSGVAINILGAGVARFLSVVAYTGDGAPTGGGATQSPRVGATIPKVDLPLLAGGLDTPDVLGRVARWRWFLVSDVAAVLRAFTGNLSLLTILTFVLIGGSVYVLWHTPFGLRLRATGEHPGAAESLGVDVYRMKYVGLVISGGLAGLGGAFLAIEQAGIYREGQTAGRGFIGLAAMIFGNWRPVGTGAGALLFGFANALELRSADAVHALLLFVTIAAAVAAALALRGRHVPRASVLGAVALGFGIWYGVSDSVPRQFISFTPHLATLLVLAFATQRLRPPATNGQVYRRGQST